MRTRLDHQAIRRPRHRIRHAMIAAAACSVLLAGCGSGSAATTGVSGQNPDTPNLAQTQRQILAFTNCMHAHGVARLTTPAASDLKAELAPTTPHSPAFRAALPACAHLLPFGAGHPTEAQAHAHTAAFMAFARCVRGHGFPSFPDPSLNGQITHEMVAGAGINVHQPAVLRAGDACAGVTHGFITKAIVARFVAGQ
jgi:hypothetical protein